MWLFLLYSFLVGPTTPSLALSWQDKVMADIRVMYKPVVANQEKKLSIEVDMAGTLVVASAESTFTEQKVVIQKALIDSPRLTADAFRLTLCHELGHIFGGSPRRYNPMDWPGPAAPDGLSVMSAEGQADYYAALVCFRELVRGEDHLQVLASQQIPIEVKTNCEKVWSGDSEGFLICERTLMGALNFLNLVKDFPISFATPDLSTPEKLDRSSYPSRQCRLDTFVAGALCRESHDLRLDFNDPAKAECGQALGRRPLCWYPR